jgi:hypothetical protein
MIIPAGGNYPTLVEAVMSLAPVELTLTPSRLSRVVRLGILR